MMTPKQWRALDLCLYELQAQHEMQPMGLMGIDLMRTVALERRENADRLLRRLDRIEAAFDRALQGKDLLK